jgi:hypothetical protein
LIAPESIAPWSTSIAAGKEEVGVRIGRGALDEDVVAFRRGLEHGLRLHAADLLEIVEGQVEGFRVFDQAVIADDRDAFGGSLFDGRADGRGVLRQDDGVGALGDQRFDVGQLLGSRRLGVSRDVACRRLPRERP